MSTVWTYTKHGPGSMDHPMTPVHGPSPTTSSPRPSPRRFSKRPIVGRRSWKRLGHVVQNLQTSWRFLSRDILRKAKTKWRRSIACETKHRPKNALTLYTRQWWLRSKIKYYFNGILILEQDFSAFVSLFHFVGKQ